MSVNESCRHHDTKKQELDAAFSTIYSMMFVFSVVLNSLLLHIVIRKEHFIHEKRAFHRLFQVLIGLDLMISILILPQILVKLLTEDHEVSVLLDGFIAFRDFAISSQMIILVLIAIDRLLALLIPLGQNWRLETVSRATGAILVTIAMFYVTRFILLSANINCYTKKRIDATAKQVIGISGGMFMLSNFTMYLILFVLLCKRQVKKQRHSIKSMSFLKTMQEPRPERNSNSVDINAPETRSPSLKKKFRRTSTKMSLSQRIGSIKFAKVLFGVNILMITSYLPGILYNARMINFPSYSVYYLFFLHALGDPVLFFLTRPELKKGLISIFRPRRV